MSSLGVGSASSGSSGSGDAPLRQRLLSDTERGVFKVRLGLWMRFKDPEMEEAFLLRRYKLHTRVFVWTLLLSIAFSLFVDLVTNYWTWGTLQVILWLAMALYILHLSRTRVQLAHRIVVFMGSLYVVGNTEGARSWDDRDAAGSLDLNATDMAHYLAFVMPAWVLVTGMPLAQWLVVLPLAVTYLWLRLGAHLAGSFYFYYGSYLIYILPVIYLTELAARKTHVAVSRLEETNVHLEVASDPFGMDAVSSWLSGAPMVVETAMTRRTVLARTNVIDAYSIPFEELRKGELIGIGGAGRVYAGEYRRRAVAIKELHTSAMGAVDLAEFAREVSMLAKLQHPNVLRFLGLSRTVNSDREDHLYLVTEFCPMVLSDELRNPRLPPPRAVAKQIADGCAFMHAQSVAHRDLKPSNVLLSAEFDVRICDFGLAEKAGGAMQTVTLGVGTYAFLPPEMLVGTAAGSEDERGRVDATKIDVYAFGLVLWTLLAREQPYGDWRGNQIQLAIAVAQDGLRPPLAAGFDEELAALAQRCWAADPRERPTMEEVSGML